MPEAPTERVQVEVLHRRRFVPVDGATLKRIAPNAWELTLPLSPTTTRVVQRPEDPEAWDGVIFRLDGRETEPAVGVRRDARTVTVSVLLLG